MSCIPTITNNNSKSESNPVVILNDLQKTPENLQDTFSFIMDRLKAMRSSEDLAITEITTPESFHLRISDAEESVNIDESYQIKNIVNPHQINQSSNSQQLLPVKNRTSTQIIMGFTYQLIQYNWKISWTLKLFGYQIAYAYFGIEIDIGAGMRFPIKIDVDYFTSLLLNQPSSLNISLQTLNLPNYNETYFHFIARIYAGVSAFGYNGEYSIGPNYREDRSYETPLGAGEFVDLGEINIPILEILGKLNIPKISQVAGIIASYVADLLIKLRFSVGSELLSIKATLYGNDTHFDNPLGSSTKILNFTQAPSTKNLLLYAKEPGAVRLELNTFKYYLNKLNIQVLLGLTWKSIFAQLFDDREWQIYTFTIPLGNLFAFESANTITVQMNGTALPKIYGARIIYISPMETIELEKDIATYYVFIENTGQNIEHDIYDVTITGVDPSWVIHPPYLTIKQGSIGYFILKIDPPREYNSAAGIHPFIVTVTSRNDPLKYDSISENLNILPYFESIVERLSLIDTGVLDVEPGATATLSFNIKNTGNQAELFLISMTTEGLNSSIFEIPLTVYLEAGASKVINPNITVPKSSEFPALRYSVKFIAQSQTNPASSTYDTVQMNILPYKNLSISIIEKSLPSRIDQGSILLYDIYVKNNGNFNDSIELSLAGLSSSSYEFGIEREILFPGQELNTTLTIIIPHASMDGDTYNLTFVAQFNSNQTLQIKQSFIIHTTPNYFPLILSLIILGAVVASSPYIYKIGVKEKLIPYVKRKLDARVIRSIRKQPDEMKVKIENCIFCFKKLTEGELKALNSNLNTLCEKCGNILKPEYLEISVPKQKSINEVVSEKMKKTNKELDIKRAEQEYIKSKRTADEKLKQYEKKLTPSTAPVIKSTTQTIKIEYCPHCFKNLSSTDINILKKGEMTFCSHCKKIIKPEAFGK